VPGTDLAACLLATALATHLVPGTDLSRLFASNRPGDAPGAWHRFGRLFSAPGAWHRFGRLFLLASTWHRFGGLFRPFIKAIWRRTWCLTPMWNPQCLTSDYASNDDFEGEREIKFKLFYYY